MYIEQKIWSSTKIYKIKYLLINAYFVCESELFLNTTILQEEGYIYKSCLIASD